MKRKFFPFVFLIAFLIIVGGITLIFLRKKELSTVPKSLMSESTASEVLPSAWLEPANENAGKKQPDCVAAKGWESTCEVGNDERQALFNQLVNGLAPNGLWLLKSDANQKLQLLSTKDNTVIAEQQLNISNKLTVIPYWSSDNQTVLILAADETNDCHTFGKCEPSREFFSTITTDGKLLPLVDPSLPFQEPSTPTVAWSPDSSQVAMYFPSQTSMYFFTKSGSIDHVVKLSSQPIASHVISLLWKDQQLWYTTLALTANHVASSEVFILPVNGKTPQTVTKIPVSMSVLDWNRLANDNFVFAMAENRALPFLEDTQFWMIGPKGQGVHFTTPEPKDKNLFGGTYCWSEGSPEVQKVTAILLSTGGSCDSNMRLLFFNWDSAKIVDSSVDPSKQLERLLPWSPVLHAFPVIEKDINGKYIFDSVRL